MNWEIKKFNELNVMELYNILKVRTDVFVVEQECPYSECDGKDIKSYHLYTKDGDDVIAYLRILPPGLSYEESSIGRVLVRKDNRGKGLAKEMMKIAMNFIKEDLKEYKIRLSGQEYLINFYKDLGFQVVSDMYLEDGIPHVEMIYQF